MTLGNLEIARKIVAGCGFALAVLVPCGVSGFEVLYSFAGGSDGANPYGDLVADNAGNLYSTTANGGTNGYGTVFMLAPNGTKTVLHSFKSGSDGANPYAGVIADTVGNVYGTTEAGGRHGYGTVFEVPPNGAETVLYSFKSGSDGANPYAGLKQDRAGNLYGTTKAGGVDGYGTVFVLAPNGTETVLYAFKGGSDGANPYGRLRIDGAGNLYGTTANGGTDGYGTVFELAPNGTETVLHSFASGSDGANPDAGVIRDSAGNLYGTTPYGGIAAWCAGCGIVFKLAPDGTETVLYTFGTRCCGEAFDPYGGVIADTAGNLYGTTQLGGNVGAGTIFKLAPDGTETILHSFRGGKAGLYPVAGLLMKKGYLYGTTSDVGANEYGTVFERRK